MKIHALLFLASMGLSTLAFAQSDSYVGTITETTVDLTITPSTTRDQLARMQKDLHEQGLSFRYDNIDWINGELVSIQIGLKDPKTGTSQVFMTEDLGGSTSAIRVFMDRTEGAPTPIYIGEANTKH